MNFNDKYQQIKIISTGIFGMLLEVIEKNNEKNHYALKFMKNS